MSVSKRRVGGFSLSCGCRDSKAASVSDSSTRSSTTPCVDTPRVDKKRLSFAEALTLSSTTSSPYHWINSEQQENVPNSPTTPSFSGLLRQLGDLERSVENWSPRQTLPPKAAIHRRSRSSGKVGESVAVVKETADPLGDFRRSMLQMIVEKDIVSGEELRELLRRFLSLNSPMYHELILRAFAEIWTDIFSGVEHTPDLLLLRSQLRP